MAAAAGAQAAGGIARDGAGVAGRQRTGGNRPLHVLGLFALLFALAKELSGEAALERARVEESRLCECGGVNDKQLYIAVTTRRFKGVNRCC